MGALTVTTVIKIVLPLTALLLFMNVAEDMISIGLGWEPIRTNAVLTRKTTKNRPLPPSENHARIKKTKILEKNCTI